MDGFKLWSWAAQTAQAERMAREMAELDARETEAWRMFGALVEQVMDERVILCADIVYRAAPSRAVPLWSWPL